MYKCIVTGATGWEVTAIVRDRTRLRYLNDMQDGIEIFEYDGDIQKLITLFSTVSPDVVFHIAASIITNDDSSRVKPLIASNIEFGTEILEAMKRTDSHLFVTTGTNWQNYNSSTYNPVDLYAATKEAFEKIVQYYVDAHGIRAISLRLFDVYGDDDDRPKLLNLLKSIAGTDQIIDVTEGEQLIHMVHIDDIVNGYIQAYQVLKTTPTALFQVYGLPSKQAVTLRTLVGRLEKVIDKKIKINWGGRRYKDREVMIPTDAYETLPGWQPSREVFIN